MESINLDENFWTKRYELSQTGWDIGYISTPLKTYFDQLQDKNLSILIPGAGNGYEAVYLEENGFNDVTVCDISDIPLERLKKYSKLKIIHGDFFQLVGQFDLIIEQTFFCALHPTLREKYRDKVFNLLKEKGKLVGILFDRIFEQEGPPFGGNSEEYIKLFSTKFNFGTFEKCYNSIAPRAGYEIFINLMKKN